MTPLEWGEAWRRFETYLLSERNFSNQTLIAYRSDLGMFRNFHPGISAAEITAEHIKSFLQETTAQGLSISTRSRYLSSIKHFFKYLVEEGLLPSNPMDKVRYPKKTMTLPKPLSEEEISKVFRGPDKTTESGARDLAALELLYGSGLRISELCAAQWEDLDWEARALRVTGKGNKVRIVPVSKEFIKAITRFWAFHPQKSRVGFLFINTWGNPLTPHLFRHRLQVYLDAHGVKGVTPHRFRHSFATHLHDNGADIRTIQEVLGHASLMTTQLYTHVSAAKVQETVEKFHPRRKMKI